MWIKDSMDPDQLASDLIMMKPADLGIHFFFIPKSMLLMKIHIM